MCASPQSGDVRSLEPELDLLADRIGELAQAIDLAWQRAQPQQSNSGAEMVLALTEASQGLHRARVALTHSTRCSTRN